MYLNECTFDVAMEYFQKKVNSYLATKSKLQSHKANQNPKPSSLINL